MRPLPSFAYHRPGTVEEALRMLNSLDNAKPLAGGTDLVPLLREGVIEIENLVDLSAIPDLRYVREKGGYIRIGAATTHSQANASPLIRRNAHALHDSISRIGSPQIRNLGTIVGNICNASPAADSAPPLLVLDAEAEVRSAGREKVIPLDRIFAGPKMNRLEPNEIVTEIRFPVPPSNSSSAYLRIGRRRAFTLSVVGAAAYIDMEGEKCSEARVAFGSVAKTPIRIRSVEEILSGKELTPDLIKEAGEVCKNDVEPLSDVRGTAEYRRDMCAVLLERALKRSLDAAR